MLLHILLLFRPPPPPLSNRDEKGANALQEGTHVTSKLAFLRYAHTAIYECLFTSTARDVRLKRSQRQAEAHLRAGWRSGTRGRYLREER